MIHQVSSHMLHVWNIYWHLPYKWPSFVGIHIPAPWGICRISGLVIWTILKNMTVNWNDDIPNILKKIVLKIPKNQPDIIGIQWSLTLVIISSFGELFGLDFEKVLMPTRWHPPSYKLAYNPINYGYIYHPHCINQPAMGMKLFHYQRRCNTFAGPCLKSSEIHQTSAMWPRS